MELQKDMRICINGQSQVPPGFRFHPTEEELLQYYLTKKLLSQQIDLDVIRDIDLNKLEPWDIQDKCKIGSTPQNEWYFFSHKDKKYPTGRRTNRATSVGFWKATGRDKVIYSNSKTIGMRKTLVFYLGRAPHGQKSHWIMHEYRLFEDNNINKLCMDMIKVSDHGNGEAVQEEGWVVCRAFKKKDNHKVSLFDKPLKKRDIVMNEETNMTRGPTSIEERTLEQIIHGMGNIYKDENGDEAIQCGEVFHTPLNDDDYLCDAIFMKLPGLGMQNSVTNSVHESQTESNSNCWAAIDRLIASELNSQSETMSLKPLACFNEPNIPVQTSSQANHNGELDLWSLLFTRSSVELLE